MRVKVSEKAFVFSADSFLALFLVFSTAFLYTPHFQGPDLARLHALQKSNDLLKVWLLERSFNPDAMLYDVKSVFPQNCAVVELRGKALNSCPASERFVSSSVQVLDDSLASFSLRVTVHY